MSLIDTTTPIAIVCLTSTDELHLGTHSTPEMQFVRLSQLCLSHVILPVAYTTRIIAIRTWQPRCGFATGDDDGINSFPRTHRCDAPPPPPSYDRLVIVRVSLWVECARVASFFSPDHLRQANRSRSLSTHRALIDRRFGQGARRYGLRVPPGAHGLPADRPNGARGLAHR